MTFITDTMSKILTNPSEFISELQSWLSFGKSSEVIKLTKEHDDGYQNQLYGHSIGWYEDDTLVIDTIGSGSGVLLPYPGVLHSDQLHFVEKIKLNDDGLGFMLTWLAEDSIHYKKILDKIID